MMIDKNQAQDICKKALSFVKEGQAEVNMIQTVSPLTRIANNTIHQNVETSNLSISLRVDIRRAFGPGRPPTSSMTSRLRHWPKRLPGRPGPSPASRNCLR